MNTQQDTTGETQDELTTNSGTARVPARNDVPESDGSPATTANAMFAGSENGADEFKAAATMSLRASQSSEARPMQKRRFLAGLVLSSLGIGLMLIVAVGALQNAGLNGRLSLPVVGLCMIIGLMLLGGGFGIMATSAPTFDDHEFDRLVRSGDNDRSLATRSVAPEPGFPSDRPVGDPGNVSLSQTSQSAA